MDTGELLPIAAELIGCTRDFGPDAVAEVLDPLSVGHLYRLAVVLAAMVDPDKTPAQLLAWMDNPVQSRTFEPTSLRPDLRRVPCPDCGGTYRQSHLSRHRRVHVERDAA